MYQQFENGLRNISDENQILKNEPMRYHTTFKIGGIADYYLKPKNEEQLSVFLKLCQQENIPYYIIGNGSNILVGDYGYKGVVIEIKECFSKVELTKKEDGTGMIITAGAGILLSKFSRIVAQNSLTGMEFACGIPGTLGGAVAMNAGAYDGEIKDTIISAKVIDKTGKISELSKEELELGYRTSRILREEYIVISATFMFAYGMENQIIEKMKDYNKRRKEKQPLEYPSAGSTFKRPKGYFAGKLIMDTGLSGFQMGDIMVSEKHCGFVINKGNGTASDVKRLITKVIEKVKESYGVTLEPEIRFIGEFESGQEEEK